MNRDCWLTCHQMGCSHRYWPQPQLWGLGTENQNRSPRISSTCCLMAICPVFFGKQMTPRQMPGCYFPVHFWSQWLTFLSDPSVKTKWIKQIPLLLSSCFEKYRETSQTLDTAVLSATGCFSPCQHAVIKGERHQRGTRSEAPSSWKGHCRKWAISAPCCRGGFGCRKSCRNTMSG